MKTTQCSRIVFSMLLVCMLLAGITVQPAAAQSAQAPFFAPPEGMFQWPWPLDQSWQITQGPHGTNWSGLDINDSRMDWNSSERQEVRAAAGGKVIERSACFVQIEHADGWGTGYVHIRTDSSIQKGVTVSANQLIGILETNKAAAQCGGKADGPHLHFRLYYNKVETSIMGATFGGWKVGAENGYTPDNGKRSLYTKNGTTKYISNDLDNKATVKVTTVDPKNVFKNGSSSLYQDQNWGRANLKICADNLAGNTVYVDFRRDGKVFNIAPQKATSNCVTFWDLDGAGPLNRNTTYYSRAAFNQPPDAGWAIPCAGSTAGRGLCDALRRN